MQFGTLDSFEQSAGGAESLASEVAWIFRPSKFGAGKLNQVWSLRCFDELSSEDLLKVLVCPTTDSMTRKIDVWEEVFREGKQSNPMGIDGEGSLHAHPP